MLKSFFKVWFIGLIFLVIINVVSGKGYDSIAEMFIVIGIQILVMSIVAFILAKKNTKNNGE